MLRIATLAFFALLGFASSASAHGMIMTVIIKPSETSVLIKYDGEDHGSGITRITITNLETKAVVAVGIIGSEGDWTTPNPPPGKYSVIAEDDFGHRTVQKIEILPEGQQQEQVLKAGEPFFSTVTGMIVAIVIIALISLFGYLIVAKKKV